MAADSASVGGAPWPETPLPAFKLERFFAEYEFVAPHLLCCSDCEPLAMADLLQLADAETMSMWGSLRLGYTETAGLPVRGLEEPAHEAPVPRHCTAMINCFCHCPY